MPAEFDIIVAENRRLVREVKELRSRVDALESSRWWRLHPRLFVRRFRKVRATQAVAEEPAAADRPPDPTSLAADGLTARFRSEVIARGSFRSDMVSGNFARWEPILEQLDGKSARILEIGSFEGMSACYFLWRLPDAHVTCIDTFAGGPSFAARGSDVSGLEASFDGNVALVGADRVRKLVGSSTQRLPELVREGATFDLIFVDGSDLALDVLVDASLSWQMLAPDGHLIFDNYVWRSPLGEDPLLQAAPAVDAFIELVGDHCEVSFSAQEAIVRRLGVPAAVSVSP